MYKLGDYFRDDAGVIYILSQVEYGKINLISLDEYSNRFSESIICSNLGSITGEEFRAIVGYTHFEKINVEIKVIESTYKVGDILQVNDYFYLICYYSKFEVSLVNLSNYYVDNIKLDKPKVVTRKELNQVFPPHCIINLVSEDVKNKLLNGLKT